MKRILTGLFAILLVLSLALTVMTVSVSAMMAKAAEQSPAPTTRDTTLSRKKVQTSKSGLHLLLTANIQRHLLANLVPAYQAAHSKKLVRRPPSGTPNRNIGAYLNSDAESTQP